MHDDVFCELCIYIRAWLTYKGQVFSSRNPFKNRSRYVKTISTKVQTIISFINIFAGFPTCTVSSQFNAQLASS